MFRKATCKPGVSLIHFPLSSSAVTAHRKAVKQHTHQLLKSNQFNSLLYQQHKHTPHIYPKLSAKTQWKQQAKEKAYFSYNTGQYSCTQPRMLSQFKLQKNHDANLVICLLWSVLPVLSAPTSNPSHRTNKNLRSKSNYYNCIFIVKALCNSSACSFTIRLLKSPLSSKFFQNPSSLNTFAHGKHILFSPFCLSKNIIWRKKITVVN